MEVEVYSHADQVELLLNEAPIGRANAGPEHHFRAHFDVEYHPGTLTAIAYSDGMEQSRTSLRTANGVGLVAETDRRLLRADHSDLAFVTIELRDKDGNLANAVDRVVTIEVTGPGVLQALGSARPSTHERFDSPSHATFDGRALAIVRPTGAGVITVGVTSEGLHPVTLELQARAAG